MECLRSRFFNLDADLLVILGYIVGLEVKLRRVEAILKSGVEEPKILVRNRLQLPVLRHLLDEAKGEVEKIEREMREIEVSLFLFGCQPYELLEPL